MKPEALPQPHNPDVANAFFRAGEIEAWGRGIERIFNACRQAGAPEPQLRLDAGGLWMTFAFDEAYLRAVRGAAPQVTTEVTTEVSLQLALLQALTQPLARRDLQAALGLKNDEHFRKAYLLPALSEDLIEMTVPDKPNSRLQQYRLTPAGRARLRALKPPEQP